MLKVEFETTTLVDAIGKAGRFAPTKGSALDKSGGIVLDFETGIVAKVMATDLDNSLVRWVPTTDCFDHPGHEVRLRVAHLPLIAVLNGLPIEAGGRTILWADDAQWAHIECGTIRAKLALYDPGIPYPSWFAKRFIEDDDNKFAEVENFATKISQVAWATDPKSEKLCGVHLTGDHAYATNSYSVVSIPLDCPVPRPVTVAIDSGLALLRDHPEIALRATEDELQVMLDDDAQVTCRMIKASFPNVSQFFAEKIPDSLIIERGRVLAALSRVTAPFADKLPRVLVEIRDDVMTFTMSSPEAGKISDEVEHGQNVKSCDLWLTPMSLKQMLEGATDDRLELCYHGDEHPSTKAIKVVDRHGYEAITMPRTKP